MRCCDHARSLLLIGGHIIPRQSGASVLNGALFQVVEFGSIVVLIGSNVEAQTPPSQETWFWAFAS